MKKWRIVKVVKKAKSGKVLDSYFKVVSEEKPKTLKKLSMMDVLEGCMHSARKCSYDYDLEDEIDSLLGADPYTPLY